MTTTRETGTLLLADLTGWPAAIDTLAEAAPARESAVRRLVELLRASSDAA